MDKVAVVRVQINFVSPKKARAIRGTNVEICYVDNIGFRITDVIRDNGKQGQKSMNRTFKVQVGDKK